MSKVIVLDAGHGHYTAGKRCLKSIDPYQTREWVLNARIMDKIETMLKEYDCKVIRSDDTTGNKDISLSARVKTANNAKADIFISMHHNAGANGRSVGGTVIYYYSNKEERKYQAEMLYKHIVDKTGLIGNRSEKTIKNGFHVIKYTTMPAFLVENGFMDSTKDTPIILTEEHAQKTARGVVKFLVNELDLQKIKEPKIESDEFYKPYTGISLSLVDALNTLGITSTYAFRKKIAVANGISGYIGTATQNTRLYNLLKAGLLKKA